MYINNRLIDDWEPVYLVAELSGNHDQDINIALQSISEAKRCGADAVKIQCYTPEDMTIDSNKPHFRLTGTQWQADTLFQLYQRNATPREWWPTLFDYAKRNNITLFASVFSPETIDYLEKLKCPAYKIASMEICYADLLKAVGETGKPVILSAGLARDDDLHEAVQHLGMEGREEQLAILHCVSSYPATIKDSELNRIRHLEYNFPGVQIGLSSHTNGILDCVVAVALGAVIIEKHFLLDASRPTDDAEFSLTPYAFKTLRQGIDSAYQSIAMVSTSDPPCASEQSARFMRSVYAVKDIKQGETFTADNIRVIRPGYGAHPRQYNVILGTVARNSYSRGDPIDTVPLDC